MWSLSAIKLSGGKAGSPKVRFRPVGSAVSLESDRQVAFRARLAPVSGAPATRNKTRSGSFCLRLLRERGPAPRALQGR